MRSILASPWLGHNYLLFMAQTHYRGHKTLPVHAHLGGREDRPQPPGTSMHLQADFDPSSLEYHTPYPPNFIPHTCTYLGTTHTPTLPPSHSREALAGLVSSHPHPVHTRTLGQKSLFSIPLMATLCYLLRRRIQEGATTPLQQVGGQETL